MLMVYGGARQRPRQSCGEGSAGQPSSARQDQAGISRIKSAGLSHEPRYVPSYNAVLIANRVHFGEILNDAGCVGLRLREQSRSQTKAFDRQPWIPDGLGDGKSSLQRGQPTLRFPVPHEGLSIARMEITHLHLARPQMHPAFQTGFYKA